MAQSITTTAATFAYPLDTTRRTLMMNLKEVTEESLHTHRTWRHFFSLSHSSTWKMIKHLYNKGIERKLLSLQSTPLSTKATHMSMSQKHSFTANSLSSFQRMSAGLSMFYSGFSVNLLRGISGAMLLLLYDELNKRLRRI